MKLYALLDKKAGAYGGIMMAPNDGILVRTVLERIDGKDTLSRFPEDFDLYELGEFDDQSGRLSQSDVRFVCNMSTVIEAPDKKQLEFGFRSERMMGA